MYLFVLFLLQKKPFVFPPEHTYLYVYKRLTKNSSNNADNNKKYLLSSKSAYYNVTLKTGAAETSALPLQE